MRMMLLILTGLLNPRTALILLLSVFAGELHELSVVRDKGGYAVRVDMLIDAPAASVRAVLTDFENIHRLNPSIVESETLPAYAAGTTRVRTVVSDCLAIFCLRIERVEDLQTLASGDLVARTVAELSDLESGVSLWRIIPDQNGSRVLFEGSLRPGFFVVPVIGPYVIKRKLREQMLVSIENLDRIAQVHAAVPIGPLPDSAVSLGRCGQRPRVC